MNIKNYLLNELVDVNKILDFLKLITDEKVTKLISMFILFDSKDKKVIFEVEIGKEVRKIECFADIVEVGG